LQAAEGSRQRLREPWAIDQNEEDELREAGFLMVDPPKNTEVTATEAILIVRAGEQILARPYGVKIFGVRLFPLRNTKKLFASC
jgi:hypothetical protein